MAQPAASTSHDFRLLGPGGLLSFLDVPPPFNVDVLWCLVASYFACASMFTMLPKTWSMDAR
jgi:hypothetical protein